MTSPDEPLYRYAIAYVFSDNGRNVFGRVDLDLVRPILDDEDVQQIETELRNSKGLPDAFVMAFSLYGGD